MTTAPGTVRPDEPAVLAGFLLAATGLAVAAGAAGAAGSAVRVDLDIAFRGVGGELLQLWMRLAVVLAVLAPAATLARWGADPAVRRALLPYLGVLLVQVGTEATLPRLLPSWTVLLTGTLYTGFRLWQLRTARADLASALPATHGRRAARALVTAGLGFWALNLAVLAASVPALTRTP